MLVEMRGKELLEKNLYKNLVMHMSNLCDYGLVSPEVLYKTIQKLQRLWNSYENGPNVLIQSNEKQLRHWNEFGQFKQQQNELKAQQLKMLQKESSPLPCDNELDVVGSGAGGHRQTSTPKTKKDIEAAISPKKNDFKDGKLGLATVPLIKMSSKISSGTGAKTVVDESIASTLSRRKSLNQLKDKSGSNSSSNSNSGLDKKKLLQRGK